jgi:hypothetical protein
VTAKNLICNIFYPAGLCRIGANDILGVAVSHKQREAPRPPPRPNSRPPPRHSSSHGSSHSSNSTVCSKGFMGQVEGGRRGLKDQAAMLAHAEQIRATQQLTNEQVGQLVRQTRSRTKAACTQTAPSARASTSKAHISSNSSTTAVKRTRRSPAAVVVAKWSRSRFWAGEGQPRRSAVEQRAFS